VAILTIDNDCCRTWLYSQVSKHMSPIHNPTHTHDYSEYM